MVSASESLDCITHELLPVLDRSGNAHCYNCIIESEVEAPAEVKAPALRKAEAAPQAAAGLESQVDSEAAAPVEAMAEVPIAEATKAESAPPPVAELAAADTEEIAKTETTPPPPITDLYGAEGTPESALTVQNLPRDVSLPRGTNVFWRILEGLSADSVLASLGDWLLRRRSTR